MGNCAACKPPTSDDYESDDSDEHFKFAGGNVSCITTNVIWKEKLREANRDGKIVLANFSASWCGPCKRLAPFFIEMSEKYTSMMFLLVDVNELSELTSSLNIIAAPTFVFLQNGEAVDKLVGANELELEKRITTVLNSVASAPQRQLSLDA